MPRRGSGPWIPVWQNGGTATSDRRFFPATGPIQFEFAFQDCDDGETWPDFSVMTVVGTVSRTADSVSYEAQYETITINKEFARLGFAVRNATTGGGALRNAYAALRYLIKNC